MKDRWHSKYGRFKKFEDVETCSHAYILLEKMKQDLPNIPWYQFRKRFIMEKEMEWLEKRTLPTFIPYD